MRRRNRNSKTENEKPPPFVTQFRQPLQKFEKHNHGKTGVINTQRDIRGAALDLLWTRKTLNEVLVKAKQRLLNHTVSQAPHSTVVATGLVSNIICVKKTSFKMRPLRDVNFIISLTQGRKFVTKFY